MSYAAGLGEREVDPEILQVWPLTAPYESMRRHHGLSSAAEAAQYMLYRSCTVPDYGNDGGSELFFSSSAGRVWVPSSRLGGGSVGPLRQHDVMVVGKMPGQEEVSRGLSFCGPAGKLLERTARAAGIVGVEDWYCGNVVRFLPDAKSDKPSVKHVRDCMPLLAHDIAYVKPKFLLLLGADAVKVFFGAKATLSYLRGQIFVIDNWQSIGHPPRTGVEAGVLDWEYTIRVFVTVHPAAVLREQGLSLGFSRDMEVFNKALHGSGAAYAGLVDVSDREYLSVCESGELTRLVDRLLAQPVNELAVDCEWIGSDPYSGALRTVQFSWDEGKACAVVFKRAGGVDACSVLERAAMLAQLRRLFLAPGMQIIGHNVRADLKWLAQVGLDIAGRVSFDTMLADHVLNENAEHGLENCTLRYTDMGRYDWPLARWHKEHGLTEKKLAEVGFRDVPDELLVPYGCCDADATFRCALVLRQILAKPDNAGPQRCYKEVVMPCTHPLHEMETTGILVDRDRMESMVWAYDTRKDALLEEVRVLSNRPQFNPRSHKQMTQLLFGPRAANGLGFTPYKTTGKPQRMWFDLGEDERLSASPCTDTESLEWLSVEHEDPVLEKLCNFKLVDQITKSFLRKPDGAEDEDEYTSGLMGCIDPDGRVRTTLSQMSETGRQKSSKPNMTNLPKKQDKALERVMGKDVHKLRSCFISSPGTVLVEADYRSAEIYTLGYLANCSQLIKDAGGDLHARGAVTRMGAPKWSGFDEYKPPPDEWLKAHNALRISSKAISFGIPYQRGAKAIARQIVKDTKGAVDCDKDKAQRMIDQWYAEYAEVHAYVQLCKAAVTSPGYIENPFGRRRRFSAAGNDQQFVAAQEREAVNFPIQSTVADTMNKSLSNLYWFRVFYPEVASYKILLAIHDAAVLEVPGRHVKAVLEKVLPFCLSAEVPPWRLTRDQPYSKKFKLDVDMTVSVRWGETPTADELRAGGLPEELVGLHARKQ